MRNFDPTEWVRTAVRFLLVQYPTRTSMGLCGGLSLRMMITAFRSYFPAGIDTGAFSPVYLAIFGVFVANASLLWKSQQLPQDLEEMFSAIDLAAKKDELTKMQQRMLYIQVCQRVTQKSRIPQVNLGQVTVVKKELNGLKSITISSPNDDHEKLFESWSEIFRGLDNKRPD